MQTTLGWELSFLFDFCTVPTWLCVIISVSELHYLSAEGVEGAGTGGSPRSFGL